MKINLIDFILGKFKSLKNDIKLLEKNKVNNIDLEQLRGYNISSYEFLIAEGYPLELATYKENVEDGANFNKRYINIDKDISKATVNTDIVLSFIYEKNGEKKIYQKFEKYSTDKFIDTVQLPFIEGNPSIQISLYKNKQYNKNFEQIDSNKCSVLLNYGKKEADIIDEIDEIYFRISIRDRNVLTKDNTQEYIPTNDYEPATKKYVDDKIPSTEDSNKYIFKKTITKTINFNDSDIIVNTGNFPSVIKNLEITNELSGKEILGVKIESDDGISCINDVKEYYLNGETLIINDSTTKDANGKVIQFMITFNRKAIKNNDAIQYEENKDYCTFVIRSKESGKHPLNDYNRSKIWTVTFTYYEDNPNYYAVLYNLPTNIENGNSEGSIQQIGNISTGVFALGNKNNGKGYLLGASNSSENTSCIFGKGNKGIGTTPGYIIGERNASHGTGGGLTFGSGNIVEGTTIAVGRKLNTNAPKDTNKGAMIIGQGGTLADDTRFAISTSNANCTETRYPFEAKEDGSTYLRGKNVLLETEDGIVEDKAIVNKKYVDDKIASSPQLSFNETGELVVTINGVSKTFVPKG